MWSCSNKGRLWIPFVVLTVALQCDVTHVLPAENLILDAGSVVTASPALNHCHLHGELSGRTFKDDMADDMWALGVTFHDMITSTSPSGKSAFEATKSDIQAVQAERPDDSHSDQRRRALLNEQIKWVSRPVQNYKVYLLMHPYWGQRHHTVPCNVHHE